MPDIISIILCIIIGVGIGSFITYLSIKRRLQDIIQKNNLQEQENQLINEHNKQLKQDKEQLITEYNKTKEIYQKIQDDLNIVVEKKSLATAELADVKHLTALEEEKLKNIKNEQNIHEQEFQKLKNDQEERLEELKEKQDELFEIHAEKLSEQAEQWVQEAKDEYAKTLEDSVNDYIQKTEKMRYNINELSETLANLRRAVDAAVEADKRAAADRAAADFYRLILSNEDKEEISKLRTILPYLRDKEPLNKVIYKCYYEKPYTDLIGRVVGSEVKTGIYKITNIENGMSYVGQAADIADRWRQHIKRGLGAEPPTRNKLYPAMLAIGVENFTFEIIEECSRAELNEREDFWQEFYHTKDWGYSIK